MANNIRKTPGDTAWFMHDRFGMFIHFGLYSVAGRHEWMKHIECTTDEVYDKYLERFNPDLFDPKEWARQAKAAGMKYAVLTTKHHEGFCLFDSQYTDYKITNTPYGKDLVREYVEAFREAGIKVGLYYSLIDWHHPDFTIDWLHPRRFDPDAEEKSARCNFANYIEYMHNQVREIMTNYGKIDILWFDFSYKKPGYGTLDSKEKPLPWMKGKAKEEWQSERLIKMVRELQPGIIINNRADVEQDTVTPEQSQPVCWPRHKETGEKMVWEVCQTFSGSWGYHRDEMTWKSPEMLIGLLINTVSRGGNLIMNVGPTGRGNFDARAVNALGVYEKWMKYNSASVYGCTEAEGFEEPRDARLTMSEDGKRLYVHLMAYPFGKIAIKGLRGKIKNARFLHDGSELLYAEKKGYSELPMFDGMADEDGWVYINLPTVKPDVVIPVIEINLK